MTINVGHRHPEKDLKWLVKLETLRREVLRPPFLPLILTDNTANMPVADADVSLPTPPVFIVQPPASGPIVSAQVNETDAPCGTVNLLLPDLTRQECAYI